VIVRNINADSPVISWWSGGITSAVACRLCIDWFGRENIRLVFIDTHNEDVDTYRFKRECETWYSKEIETISNPDFSAIREVWYKSLSLNVATGAKCSQMLKRVCRERFEKENRFSYQAFGFTIDEIKRAKGHFLNNAHSRPIFPLIMNFLSKPNCLKIIEEASSLFHPLAVPRTYKMGFLNNNCFQTGCVQGGIGYWQKMRDEYPDKFNRMALVEHELTNLKGQPVTMLKDQSKDGGLVFLKPHPAYPQIKDISMMKGRPPRPLMECNGFCGTNDLERNPTEDEINYQITEPS
jgi:phosphoadenosine phosphosulfate reductase family protein